MKKTGKLVKYVNSDNFLSETPEENFSYDQFFSDIPDAIRYFSKNYWTQDSSGMVLAKDISRNVMFDIETLDDSTILLKANKTKFTKDIISETGILERVFDKEKWSLFLNNNIPSSNRLFTDFRVDITQPIDTKEEFDSNQKNISYIKKESKYNFFSKKYESLVNDRAFNETTLPYIFAILNNPNLDIRTGEENLVLTLGGLLADDYAESLFLAKDYSDIVKKYFDVYSDTYRNTDSKAVIEALGLNSTSIKLNSGKLDLLNNNVFVPFPYHMDIAFSNLSNYDDALIHKMDDFGSTKQELQNYLMTNLGNSEKINFITDSGILEEQQVNEYDLKTWIDTGISGNIANSLNRSAVIEYGNLVNYIKTDIKPQARKYKNINDEISYSEAVLYRIDKKLSSYTSNNTVQTFWLDPTKSDIIRFVDTQVKYGTDYYYTITMYVVTVGNTYFYEEYYGKYGWQDTGSKLEQQMDIENGIYKIKVNNKPLYKIFEMPYSKFVLSVNENPYTKPIVSFQKDNDKLRININQSEDSSYDNIKIIENRDFKVLESLKKSQDNIDKETIYCKNNKEGPVTLQIYKTTIKPLNYLSFQGRLFKSTILNNDSTFTDSIVPGIKYYYAFRYLNNHDTPSDLSKIYEVILKDEDGYMYLETKEINLEATKESLSFKPFKRYLLVRPSITQIQPQRTSGLTDPRQIKLGPDTGSVWDKDFILRITSKKTNRIVEFNLRSIINPKKE